MGIAEKLLNRKHIEISDRMDSGMKPPKYEEVVLNPPNSSVFTVSAPGQYNLQIPDQSPPPQASSPQVKFSDEAQCVSCPSCQQEVKTEVSSEVSSFGWSSTSRASGGTLTPVPSAELSSLRLSPGSLLVLLSVSFFWPHFSSF